MSRYSELFKAPGKNGQPPAETDELADSGMPETAGHFTLLFVDDEENVLKALRRIFLEENYEIFTVTSAEKALAVMSREKVHLLISDHRMPGMSGAQLLKEVKDKWPDTIRIMLTGHADVQSIIGAVKEGAVYKFITKPWNDEDLRLTVSLALQQYSLIQENKRLKDMARQQQGKIRNYSGLFDENRSALGNILISSGVITKDQLAKGLMESREREFLGDALVRLRIASEEAIVDTLRTYLKIDYVDLREITLSHGVVKCLPRELCEKNRLLPVRLEGNQLTVAMADPSDVVKCDNIARVTGLRVVPVLAASSAIQAKLDRTYGDLDGVASDELELMSEMEPLDEIDIVIEEEERDISVDELLGSSRVPPIVRIVNAIISEAIRYKASDIHIEPKTKYTVVRFRIDGMLHGKIKIPAELHAATISRVKILAKMDISERRRPQDGRITVKAGTRLVDLRVSSMPTINGEKIVLRILDKSSAVRKIEELGVLPDDLKKINVMVKKPQGVIICTGPTGSGKTTMLYSMLSAMIQSSKNFETIEDPVEYFVEDASQVYVKDQIGLSFASVLRATLRQDPDVLLVGEIRDYETADVTFKASLTGHMVLTSLHTNSAVASITRLIDMGIKSYIIASALEGIVAQRLVRRICAHCRTESEPDRGMLDLLRVSPESLGGRVFSGKGCDRCNQSGYMGRLGVYEVFPVTDDYRHLISTAYRESEIVDLARANGMRTLIEDGLEKVRLGETTLDELLRVIGPQMGCDRVCGGCRRTIDAKYVFCPYCGVFRQNLCRQCQMPLEADWSNCPSCGTAKNKL